MVNLFKTGNNDINSNTVLCSLRQTVLKGQNWPFEVRESWVFTHSTAQDLFKGLIAEYSVPSLSLCYSVLIVKNSVWSPENYMWNKHGQVNYDYCFSNLSYFDRFAAIFYQLPQIINESLTFLCSEFYELYFNFSISL